MNEHMADAHTTWSGDDEENPSPLPVSLHLLIDRDEHEAVQRAAHGHKMTSHEFLHHAVAQAAGAFDALLADSATVRLALRLAADAHAGQTDKAGRSYLTHPLRVAGTAVSLARLHAPDLDPAAVAATALLHDVIEDGPGWTPQRLRDQGIDEDIITAVSALTHRSGEPRSDYLERILTAGTLPTIVKAADLLDNTDPARTAALDPDTRARLAAQYVDDLATVRAALAAH